MSLVPRLHLTTNHMQKTQSRVARLESFSCLISYQPSVQLMEPGIS